MCGRYSLFQARSALMERFELDVPADFAPRINAAPTEFLPVIRQIDDHREMSMLRWGLLPFWAKDPKIAYRMINARSETAPSKPSFRNAFQKRRCLIPFDGFFEWITLEGKKWPIWITHSDEPLQVFAGLWEHWQDPDTQEPLETFTILTTDADPILTPVHDRMPVLIPDDLWDDWLTSDAPQSVLDQALNAFPADQISFQPVHRELNKAGQEDPAWLDPIELPHQPSLFSR